MNDIVSRFMSFDKLIASSLIKSIYWLGIALIITATVVGMFSGFSQGFGSGLVSIIVAPVVGVIGIVIWRFTCEVYIVLFGMYDRLGEIQKSLEKDRI